MADGSWLRIGAVKAHLNARTLNPIIKEALGKKAIFITQMPKLRQEIGEELLSAVTPFVPMKSGQLRDSGRATDDGRLYWTATHREYNYATIVYDLDPDNGRWPDSLGGVYKKPTTPNTYPRWVAKVQSDPAKWNAFINNITPIIIRRFAEDE